MSIGDCRFPHESDRIQTPHQAVCVARDETRGRSAEHPKRQRHRQPTGAEWHRRGADYRATCRARSKAEFIAKIGGVEEEADESAFWMELVTDGEVIPAAKVSTLLQVANELTAIMAAPHISASRRR
jgi:hypothetical protein